MKTFSSRSNCVRAARKELEDTQARAGVHFNVIEAGGKFSYTLAKPAADPLELPACLKREPPSWQEAEEYAARFAKFAKDASPERELVVRKTAPKTKTPKRSDKTATLLTMLKGNGSSVDAITKATDWLPHSLRARLSGLAKPPHSLKIKRERRDGVTYYQLA